MRPARLFSILAALMLAPAVHAGSASSPELIDASGDAPGPVDVVAAWFSPIPPVPASTTNAALDCDLFSCGDGFRLTVKLRDLAGAAPIADTDPSTIRYYYTFSFTPSSWGEVVVTCTVNLADHATGQFVGAGGGDTSPGTSCTETSSIGSPTSAFDSSSNRFLFPGKDTEPAFLNTHVDLVQSTFTVTLIEDQADVGPGTTFSGLRVSTGYGLAKASVPVLSKTMNVDTTNVGASWTL